MADVVVLHRLHHRVTPPSHRRAARHHHRQLLREAPGRLHEYALAARPGGTRLARLVRVAQRVALAVVAVAAPSASAASPARARRWRSPRAIDHREGGGGSPAEASSFWRPCPGSPPAGRVGAHRRPGRSRAAAESTNSFSSVTTPQRRPGGPRPRRRASRRRPPPRPSARRARRGGPAPPPARPAAMRRAGHPAQPPGPRDADVEDAATRPAGSGRTSQCPNNTLSDDHEPAPAVVASRAPRAALAFQPPPPRRRLPGCSRSPPSSASDRVAAGARRRARAAAEEHRAGRPRPRRAQRARQGRHRGRPPGAWASCGYAAARPLHARLHGRRPRGAGDDATVVARREGGVSGGESARVERLCGVRATARGRAT